MSCLTNATGWPEAANMLYPYNKEVAVGLHFNLTQGQPLSSELKKMFSLKELIIKSQLRQLDQKVIAGELRAQLSQFIAEFKQLPDFIDGHQHVHQFPVVRDALFEVYEAQLRDEHAYIRSTYNRPTLVKFSSVGYVKQMILFLCGGWKFKKELVKRQIPHNTTFSGIYDFSVDADYEKLFPEFLSYVENNGMIMCHPGLPAPADGEDEIYVTRPKEFAYFAGSQFLKLLETNNISLITAI